MKDFLRGLGIGLAGAGLAASMASAEEWRFNNPLPETRPESAELEQWAADIGEATGGEFTVKVYSGGSLGLERPIFGFHCQGCDFSADPQISAFSK